MEKTWKEASVDSLKKYPSSFSPDEYKQLDAYTYLWALASVKQDMNAGYNHTNQLVHLFMVPAFLRDLTILERLRNREAIGQFDAGSVSNLFSLGTGHAASDETQLATIAVYKKGEQVFKSLLAGKDTLVSKAAANLLQLMKPYTYTIKASDAFYSNKPDTALFYLMEGLGNHQFPHTIAMSLSQKLVPVLLQKGKRTACMDLLHAIAKGTSTDKIDKEGLLKLYQQVDAIRGTQLYQDAIVGMDPIRFTPTGQSIALPASWNFLVNPLTTHRMAKAKYILFDFWYTGCGPCLGEIPELNKFWKNIKSRDDVVFISINTDYTNGNKNEAHVMNRSTTLQIDFPVIYDNAELKLAKQLSVTSYPFKIIVDSKGKILAPSDGAEVSIISFNQLVETKSK